jgi:general secretion pathway protein J
MKNNFFFKRILQNVRGFTLLEILLALGILSTLLFLCINLLTKQIDQRDKLTSKEQALRLGHNVLKRMFYDLKQAFLVDPDDLVHFNFKDTNIKPYFSYLDKDLIFFSTSYRSIIKNTPESNISTIRYQVVSREGVSTLVRTEDLGLKESITQPNVGVTEELISHVKNFEVECWDGGKYVKVWDSEETTSQDVIPKMVKVNLSYEYKMEKEIIRFEDASKPSSSSLQTFSLSFVVYLENSQGRKELKSTSKEGYTWQ